MSEHDIADIVREHAARQVTNGVEIEVIEGAVHREGDWWHVPVRPLAPVSQAYKYYDILIDIEDEIKKDNHLDVLLVPSS